MQYMKIREETLDQRRIRHKFKKLMRMRMKLKKKGRGGKIY